LEQYKAKLISLNNFSVDRQYQAQMLSVRMLWKWNSWADEHRYCLCFCFVVYFTAPSQQCKLCSVK